VSNPNNRPITRRTFLKLAGAGLAAASTGSLLQGCVVAPVPQAAPSAGGEAAPTTVAAAGEGKELVMWWWGEQEAAGLENWLKESLALFKEQTGIVINPTLESNDTLVPAFQTASAAGNPPDIQYFWNGIYHMESVWLGYIEPLNGLIPDDVLAASNATSLSVFQSKQYRVGWYAASPCWIYNKEMFEQAGLNPDEPPTTWEGLLDACDKLKSAGFTPILAGLKDGPWGEWYMGHGLAPNLDSPAEALKLFAGELDWREARHYEHWSKLAQLWQAGYFNEDMNSIDLYPGIELFGAGKGAMTAVVVPIIAEQAKRLGIEKVGVMVFPAGGQGQMNGKPMADTQGWGISAQSKYKQEAADFLVFLQNEERIKTLWEQVRALPVNKSWDGSQIEEPLWQEVWSKFVKNDEAIPYISNLMPTLFWTDAMFVNSQKIIAGEFTGEQAGDLAQTVSEKWRAQNPDLLEKYIIWAEDLYL
jgi:raffinose/stachyose/melibiose transport system substrate-binding protein